MTNSTSASALRLRSGSSCKPRSRTGRTPPTYLLLNGRASLDPRNYLGFGNLDLVPTRIVPSASLMTASDDWFSDFTDRGLPTIATGRLPVSTVDEATTVVGKIATYEGQSTNGPWTANALVVADKDDTESFTQDSQTVQAKLPADHAGHGRIHRYSGRPQRADIVNAINSGQVLVNYLGHGSEEQWSGSNIFDTNSVSSLTNGSQLPVFLIMDCLNGFFQDVYAQPLGVTLMLAPNGGAVAVLASSGLNQPPPQTVLDTLVVQNALSEAPRRRGCDCEGEIASQRSRRAPDIHSAGRSRDASETAHPNRSRPLNRGTIRRRVARFGQFWVCPAALMSLPIKGLSRGLTKCRSKWLLDGCSTRDSRPSATRRSYASSQVGTKSSVRTQCA